MHVETIEISDVQVASAELFRHMQTEFRDTENLKATEVRYNTDCAVREKRLEKDSVYN